MWRSFFQALGIFSIILGVETMVIDQATMSNARRFPRFPSTKSADLRFQNAVNGSVKNPFTAANGSVYQTPSYNNSNQRSLNGSTQSAATQPGAFSRFFGGLNRKPSSGSGFGLAGFNSNNGSRANPIENSPVVKAVPPGIRPRRVIHTKDWMPWSLMAAGTIIVLYTHTLPRRKLEQD